MCDGEHVWEGRKGYVDVILSNGVHLRSSETCVMSAGCDNAAAANLIYVRRRGRVALQWMALSTPWAWV